MPRRDIQGVQLTDRQYEEYARLSGTLFKKVLDTYVPTPGWHSNVPDGEKAMQIQGDLERARREAERAMLAKPNGLLQAATAYRKQMITTGQRKHVTAQ